MIKRHLLSIITLEKCSTAKGGMEMSKPARLYPKPEPVVVNTKFIVLGSGLIGIVFFVIGWTLRNIGVFL